MRGWEPPERADVLVSELLGSFGDNELSPECLDGAQRVLKRRGEGGPGPGGVGVSIPAAYTSFLQPVAAAKLWAEVKGYDDLEHAETPYVVKLHRVTLLADTQAVFTFAHPRHGDDGDTAMGEGAAGAPAAVAADAAPDPQGNARYATLTFTRPGAPAALFHGLAGYFETDLGCGVSLSTHPPTHTQGMASWFPIFFPLASPVLAPAGAPITVHMWRCVSPHKVWYEWAVEAGGQATHIHNCLGRSYHVGL
jgi:protein arginine N-methyltransferase 5